MKAFLLKIFIFFLPAEIAIGIYLVKDPFKVLYSYESYYKPREEMHVYLNRDHVGTATLLRYYDKNRYDSYIFGSSRSENYLVAHWSKYIHSDKCFHFSSSAEGLYGVERKVRLIKDRKMEMKNAIFPIDYSLLEITGNLKGRVFMKHRALTGENALAYQFKYFKEYFNKQFITVYAEYLVTGKVTPAMIKKEVLQKMDVKYDLYHNEITYPWYDSLQSADPVAYYETRLKQFNEKPRPATQQYNKPIIGPEQLKLLHSIKEVLDEKKTNYVFIINPMYDQMKLAPEDMKVLGDIFGRGNIYDFSGINSMTQDYHDYYDYFHFTDEIGARVLDSVYAHRH